MNTADSEAYSGVRLTRGLKLIRPVKFVKLVRLARAFQISSNLEDQLTLLGVTKNFFKLMRLFLFLFLTLHIFACLYWRVKVDTASETVEDFLAARNVHPEDIHKIYILCFYFIFTVMATGDISAVNSPERIFCIILFLAGSITFGTVMAQLSEMLTDLNREQEELDRRMDSYTAVLKRYRAPGPLHIKIRRWLRFQYWEETADNKKKAVLADARLPEEFRIALATMVDCDLFTKIPFLQGLEAGVRAKFTAELQLRSKTLYFTSQSVVASSKQPADKLMIVCSGVAEILLAPRAIVSSYSHGQLNENQRQAGPGARHHNNCDSTAGHGMTDDEGYTLLRVITRGEVFGDGCIIGDHRWTGSYGVNADVFARVNCSFICVSATDLQAIVRQFEFNVIRFRIQRAAYLFNQNQSHPDDEAEHGGRTTDICYENRKAIFSWMVLFRRGNEAAELRHSADSIGVKTMVRKLLALGGGADVWGLSKDGPAAAVFQK